MRGQPEDARGAVTYAPGAQDAMRALGEALGREEPGSAGRGADRGTAASGEAGRALAAAGVPLGEALDALAGSWGSFMGGDPPFPAVRAFADAWGDGTLAWLHRLGCEDPMTGLAGPGHLRTRIAEVLRAAGQPGSPRLGHALVVADLRPDGQVVGADPLLDALVVARAGTMLRSVFAGDETLATLGGARLGVLTGAHPWLPRRATLLERMLATVAAGDEAPGSRPPHRAVAVRVLPLPTDAEVAHLLLDDLIRHRADGTPTDLPGGGATA